MKRTLIRVRFEVLNGQRTAISYRQRANTFLTWLKRQASSLWKASQTPKPGTVLASDRAVRIARKAVEELNHYAPDNFIGMVGAYWHSIMATRPLWLDEAQRLASQLRTLWTIYTRATPDSRDKGKRGPKRPLSLRDVGPVAAPLVPMPDEIEAALAFARQHPENKEAQAAVAEYLAATKR